MLTLTLLGSPAVATATQPLDLPRRQPLAILAYLALAGQPVAREHLMLLLFGDCEPLLARERIRRPLSDLRRALRSAGLDEQIITSRAEWIALDMRFCRLDVQQFTQASASDDPGVLAAALALYRGPLLDGFQLPNAPDFEQWLTIERERIELLRQDMLTRLIDAAAARAAWDAVATHARALLAADPLREDAHLRLIEAHAAQGQPGLMLRQYDTLRETLRRELDVEPLPETQARYEQLRDGRAAPAAPASRTLPAPRAVPLCGREREVAALHAAAAQTRRGTLHIVAVAGPSGIGKTRLLHEFIAPVADATIIHATAYRSPAPAPYQMLAEALRDLLPAPQNPFSAVHAAGANTGGEQRFWEELAQTLRNIAAARPLVLLLDDLQWADETLLRAVPYIARRLADAPVLLLLAYRSEDQPAALGELLRVLARHDMTTWLDLAPLDDAATAAVVQAFGHGGDQLSALLQRETEGNPFFLVEMLRSLHERGALAALDDAQPLPLPRSIRADVAERWARVPAAAQRVGEIAAVLGRSAALDLLRRVASESEDGVVRAVEQLEHAGFLTAQADDYAFAHAKLQVAIYEQLSVARRRLLHRQIAVTLQASHGPGSWAMVLAHAQHAYDWATAFAAARQSARAARRVLAFADAARFEATARAMLEQIGDDPAQRLAVLLDEEQDLHRLGRRAEQAALLDSIEPLSAGTDRLAEALHRRGRYWSAVRRWPEAQATFEQALLEAPGQLRHTIQLDLARCLAFCGSVEHAAALAQQVLSSANAPGSSAQRLHALMTLAEIAQAQGNYEQMLHWATAARPLARTVPDLLARLWLFQAHAQLRRGNYAQTLADAQQAHAMYEQLHDPFGQANSLMTQGMAAGRLHHFDQAKAHYEQTLAIFRLLDNAVSQAGTLLNLGLIHERTADHVAFISLSEQAHALFETVGDQHGCCVSALNLAAGCFWLGRAAASETWARAALRHAEALESALFMAVAHHNIGSALFLHGQFAASEAALRQARALRPTSDVDQTSDDLWLAAVRFAQGDHAAAQAHSAAAAAAFEQRATAEHPQMVYAVRAYVRWHTGDQAGAASDLQHAQAQLEQSLANLPDAADQQRYRSAFPFNRFIRAAQGGDWHSLHPLRAVPSA